MWTGVWKSLEKQNNQYVLGGKIKENYPLNFFNCSGLINAMCKS